MTTAASRVSSMSSVKLALLAKQMRSQVEDVLTAEPIAIIGMSCRFPGGANNPEAYWQLLVNKVDAIREVPADRWDVDAVYDPDFEKPGKMSTRSGGFIDKVDQFDPAFFGISPREASRIDPQQRLFLEVAYEALEQAGQTRENLSGSQTGVFAASYHDDYTFMQHSDPSGIDPRTITGTQQSIVANRVSYSLNLRGPSMTFDTACSASLVAIHMACQSLRNRECNMALAGGVSLMLAPELFVSLSKAGFMSPDGHCWAFDSRANGFARGEGCGVIVLKRLSDALTDGDTVLALIRGSAVNQDGRSNVLTAPNGPAQQAVVRQAIKNAGIEPSDMDYVEAHGTGTILGDPIEIEALAEVVGAPRPDNRQCVLGAVKANIGHLEASAGVAGIIKIVLSMQHNAIPPQPDFRELNHHISLENTRFVIPTELYPWAETETPRYAGVSSFGVGGTNAHIVLESAPKLPSSSQEQPTNRVYALPFSAHTPDALRAKAADFRDFLSRESISQNQLADIGFTAARRRSHYDYRLAVSGQTAADLVQKLDTWLEKSPDVAPATINPKVVFVCSGQGPQWWAMGRQLLETEPVFRQAIEQIDQLLRPLAKWSLIEELSADEAHSQLNRTAFAQPALFAMQVALAALWRSWGVQPDMIIGHSVGEIAAAHLAGALSLEDAVSIVFHRGRLMDQATGFGRMAAVELTSTDAEALLAPYADKLALAAINGPKSVVLSGDKQALADVLDSLNNQGVWTRDLGVDYAFHSPQMQSYQTELTQLLKGLKPKKVTLPLVSTVLGERVTGEELNGAYWGRNIRQTVRFADGIQTVADAGITVFVELSPQPVLARNISQTLGDGVRVLASLRKGHDEHETLLAALGGLYEAGYAVDWSKQYSSGKTVSLPSYPFQRQRYWLPDRPAHRLEAEGDHPLLGRQFQSPAVAGSVFESRLSADWPAFLADHRILDQVILPATAYLEMALAAGHSAGFNGLNDVVIQEALVLPASGTRTTQVILEGDAWQLVSLDADGTWKRHATGKVAAVAPVSASRPLDEIKAHCTREMSVTDHYEAMAAIGAAFGPGFRGLSRLWQGENEMLGWIELPDEIATDAGLYHMHPALLDAALQTLTAAHADRLYLPISVDRYEVYGKAGTRVWSHAQVRDVRDTTLTGDIYLHDEAGDLVAVVIGLRCKQVQQNALSRIDDLLYEVAWQPAPLQSEAQANDAGQWLIYADEHNDGEALAGELSKHGQQYTLIHSTVNLDHVMRQSEQWRGVVYFAARGEKPESAEELMAIERQTCGTALNLIQSLVKNGTSKRLYVVTQGAQSLAGETVGAEQASLWGLANAAALEHPELHCVRVDIDTSAETSQLGGLVNEFLANDIEDQVAYRSGTRYVARLVKRRSQDAQAVQLDMSERGLLDNLTLRPVERRAPGAGEVEIRVFAAGLNFRDVMKALGVYPGNAGLLGDECAGQIVAVGEGVDQFQVGDRVMGIVTGGFSTWITTRADLLVCIPDQVRYEDAAAIPAAFLTAYYALHHVAKIKAGDRVLIHAAAGGVGMAAVQIAQWFGAEIFGTAGNPEKRTFLSALGVPHTMDSRTLNFADDIHQITNGQGVDIVLNSLAGEFIPKSINALGLNGRFLEIGKTDIWDAAQVAAIRPDVDYSVIFLADLYDSQPELVQQMLRDVAGAIGEGKLKTLPRQTFPLTEAAAAFRYMAQARQIGKIVLTQDGAFKGLPIRSDATYLITGGLGGIGLNVGRWLAGQGAQHLVLMGRRAPSESAQQTIAELQSQGVEVIVAQGDVSQADDIRAVLATIDEQMPTLRGIFHTAGVLDDGMLMQQTWERFATVFAPKAAGAWHLHQLTHDRQLDQFVLFSSIASTLGSAGQSNYSAANAFLDGLAHERRAEGLPAISINWGAWDNLGMTAHLSEGDNHRRSKQGFGVLTPEVGLAALGQILDDAPIQITALRIDAPAFARVEALAPLYSNLVQQRPVVVKNTTAKTKEPALRQQLQNAPPSKYQSIFYAHIREQANAVLGLDRARPINPRQPLNTLGLDSLMAVELRNALGVSAGTTLPATLLFDYPTIETLTDYLANQVFHLQSAEAPTAEAAPMPNKADEQASELNDLSDEEAEALLLQELSSLKKKGKT